MRAACVAGTAVVLLVAADARADAPQITVRIGADAAEVGEGFTVELTALVDQGNGSVSDPQISPPAGFTVQGPSVSTQMIMNGFGGRASVRSGLTATWALTAQKPGRYTIPSPTVLWAGKRVGGGAVSIQITPATGRPRPRQQQPSSPFLMPGSGLGLNWPFQDEPTPAEDDTDDSSRRPDLAMSVAPDPVAFVRAIVDKKNVVVGEQVTASFYVYHSQNVQSGLRAQAPFADFTRLTLVNDPHFEPASHVVIGGRRFRVYLIDREAVFPLRAGDLHTGGIRLAMATMRGQSLGESTSDDQIIHVTEPPRAGRPPGYALGDVGQLALTASVQPRRIDQGGSLAVTLKIDGTGNLPQAVRVPERTGVEWLDPEKKESVEPQNGVVRGWRTFGYVVRIKESGRVDLGEVTLPYWDPSTKTYQTAKVALGAVDVRPVAPAIDPVTKQPEGAADAPKADPFATLPGARAILGAYAPPRAPRILDGGALWLVVAAPPLLVGVFSAGASATRRARARRATKKDTPAALAAKALREAALAEASGDAKALCAALERAVHLAIEAATGLKSRGVLVADLAAELGRRGVAPALAASSASALADTEAIRFDPAPDTARTRELAARVRAVVAELGRGGGA